MKTKRILFALAVASLALPAFAQESASGDAGTLDKAKADAAHKPRPYSPYAGRNFPTRPLFGDTHLHTSYSFDAGTFGARLGPREAYQFARGDDSGRRWYEMITDGEGGKAAFEIIAMFGEGKFPPALQVAPGTPAYRGAWQEAIKAAEEFNDPRRFTAFIGYEWTSQGAFNIHRNVIFRDGAARASQVVPFTVDPPAGSANERELWKWMQAYEEKTGGDVLAIPHNGNLSNGRMFPLIEFFTGKPMDRAYVEARSKWEHLYEVTQMKGDSTSSAR